MGERLADADALPPVSQPFPARLISLPNTLIERLAQQSATQPDNAPAANQPAGTDPASSALVPAQSDALTTVPAGITPISSFDPDADLLSQLVLIPAEGTLQETLACFQLAQLMKLPFRRDSIEKFCGN